MPAPFKPATAKDKSAPSVLIKVQRAPISQASSSSQVDAQQKAVDGIQLQLDSETGAAGNVTQLKSQLKTAQAKLSTTRTTLNTSINQTAANAPMDRIDASMKVVSLEYEDTVMRASKLNITFDNYDGSNFDTTAIGRGGLITAQWGYPSDMSPPRQCRIQSVTGGQQLTVEAWGRAVDMNRQKRSRKFDGPISRADIVRKIAKENGWAGVYLDVEDTTAKLDSKYQANLTDASFLRKLAKEEGMQWWVDFDGFHFCKARFQQAPIRELRWFTAPLQGDILSYKVENDITGRPGNINVRGRDPVAKKSFNVTGQTVAPADDDPGTFAQRESLTVPTTLKTPLAAATELERRGRLNKRVTVKLNIECVGDPSMVAKSVVQITGIATRIDGPYYVRTVKHKVDSSGYRMHLELITDRTKGKTTTGSSTGPADPNALNQNAQINPETGQTGSTTYNDSRGRQGAAPVGTESNRSQQSVPVRR